MGCWILFRGRYGAGFGSFLAFDGEKSNKKIGIGGLVPMKKHNVSKVSIFLVSRRNAIANFTSLGPGPELCTPVQSRHLPLLDCWWCAFEGSGGWSNMALPCGASMHLCQPFETPGSV